MRHLLRDHVGHRRSPDGLLRDRGSELGARRRGGVTPRVRWIVSVGSSCPARTRRIRIILLLFTTCMSRVFYSHTVGQCTLRPANTSQRPFVNPDWRSPKDSVPAQLAHDRHPRRQQAGSRCRAVVFHVNSAELRFISHRIIPLHTTCCNTRLRNMRNVDHGCTLYSKLHTHHTSTSQTASCTHTLH